MSDSKKEGNVGIFLVYLIAMYGMFVDGRIILFESKGILISSVVSQLLLVLYIVATTQFIRKVLTKLFSEITTVYLFAFIFYYAISIMLVVNNYSEDLLKIVIILIPGILFGALLNRSSYTPLLENRSNFKRNMIRNKYAYYAAIAIFYAFIFQQYLSYLVFGYSVEKGFITVNNSYYQSVGDFSIIMYCGLLSIREYHGKREGIVDQLSTKYILLLLLEMLLLVLLLQMIGSNKGPLTIIFIGISFIFLKSRKSTKKVFRMSIAVISLVLFGYTAFVLGMIDIMLFSNLRLVSETLNVGLIGNSSLTSRTDQVLSMAYDQVTSNFIFGNVSIENYIHSSIISIQTHLGLIGTIMFWSFIVLKLRKIYKSGSDPLAWSISLSIIFVSIISSAFWWLPLWVAVGFIWMRK